MNLARADVRQGSRVLVVDDDEDSRAALSELLQGELLTVSEAASLAEAGSKLAVEQYDLVVLDVRFRDGSGLELIPEVRRLQRGAKVLLFTGDSEAVEGSDADYRILKGGDPVAMLERIHSLLSGDS